MLRDELIRYTYRAAADWRCRRSAWVDGVYEYACELIEETLPKEFSAFEVAAYDFKNGAESWDAFSWGGCSLIYNEDIAKRLCSPSELRKTRNGERRPNRNEEWLDVQARALRQAWNLIMTAARTYLREAAGW